MRKAGLVGGLTVIKAEGCVWKAQGCMQGPSESSAGSRCGGTTGDSLGLRAADFPTGCCSDYFSKVGCYAFFCFFVTNTEHACELYMCTLKPFS